MEYELKIITPEGKNKTITWEGKDGMEACIRYADAFRGSAVVAWRDVRHGIFPGLRPIIE